MLKEVDINTGLELFRELPMIDVRSPAEFEKAHIPGTVNIPLFSNEERAHVGTVYKQQSKEKAVEVGYQYVKPKLSDFISKSLAVAPQKKVIVHCWRGGMRSRAFAQHLDENGFDTVYILKGGYKAFRNYAHTSFEKEAEVVVLGGYTGTGKTHILHYLEKMGEQIIDLEGLAHHKGSAFGGIGQQKQPTTEQFENDLFWVWKDLDPAGTIWIEDESSRIGDVNIPMNFFRNIKSRKLIFIDLPKEQRIKHLVAEYAVFPDSKLRDSISRISKRLGYDNVKKAMESLDKGDFAGVADITLTYYDKYYLKGLNKREDKNNILKIELDSIDFQKNAERIRDFYHERRKQ